MVEGMNQASWLKMGMGYLSRKGKGTLRLFKDIMTLSQSRNKKPQESVERDIA